MGYITHTRSGSYCDVCGSILGQEEIDFECCDACGGEGFGDDSDEDFIPEDFVPEDLSLSSLDQARLARAEGCSVRLQSPYRPLEKTKAERDEAKLARSSGAATADQSGGA